MEKRMVIHQDPGDTNEVDQKIANINGDMVHMTGKKVEVTAEIDIRSTKGAEAETNIPVDQKEVEVITKVLTDIIEVQIVVAEVEVAVPQEKGEAQPLQTNPLLLKIR